MRHGTRAPRAGWNVASLVALAVAVVLTAAAPAAGAATQSAKSAKSGKSTKLLRPESTTGIAGWRLVGHYTESSITASEGVATVATAGGGSHEIYRGIGTVPAAESAAGWTHIGDPDSTDGYIIDAFQGKSTSKMYLVTTPSGQTYQYVHTLVPGELYNNSFDTISPGGQWMVSGTWETVQRLQIYPTPLLDHRTSRTGGSLKLAGYIDLDRQVHDVQGCDFVTATELVCSSTGDSKLFSNPDPLLEVTLSSPLRGHSVKGMVVDLGSIPRKGTCTGTFEPEGVDYDTATGVLRVEIIEPGSCILHTTVYEYKRARGAGAAK